jgi:hypothetical protein
LVGNPSCSPQIKQAPGRFARQVLVFIAFETFFVSLSESCFSEDVKR